MSVVMLRDVSCLRFIKIAALAGISACTVSTGAALAVDANTGLEEITVTARKREESVMKTPVVVQVLSQQQLRDLKINSIQEFQEVSPGFHADAGFGPVGTSVYLRGIGSGNNVTYADQSVGLNVDGVGFSQGTFYNAASFDMARLELLKGPQGLFYGKSTTAGIVSIYTADPTKEWDTEVTFGYETKAAEKRIDAHVSGPITDKLGVRVAGYYDDMAGYLYNPNPTVGRHRLGTEEGGGRLTLKWDDPDSRFRAKFKAGFTKEHGHMSAAATQGFGCPTGVRQSSLIAAYDNCHLDQFTQGYGDAPPYNPNINPFTATPAEFATSSFDPRMKDGQPYNSGRTVNLMLQLDYDLMQGLTLTSVTGYGWVDTVDTVNSGFGAGTSFNVASTFAAHNYSEEVRLTSNWKDSWINFMAGGLVAPSDSNDNEYGAIPDFGLWQSELVKTKTRYYSAFGQLILTPIAKWELAPGVRWTKVSKQLTFLGVLDNLQIPGNDDVNQAGLLPYDHTHDKETNTSPEVTLSYHPTEDWTVFGSYKRGYKGPGYNIQTFAAVSFNPAINPGAANASFVGPYGGEKVEGGEGGFKAKLMDNHLDVTATAYYYRFKHLQIGAQDLTTHVIFTTNAADAITKGIEMTLNYAPDQIKGLQTFAFMNYNHSAFASYPNALCWGGQSVATGCADPATGTGQNLTGKTLQLAPHWTGSVGANYEMPVTDQYSLAFNADVVFSSGYYTTPYLLPSSYQKGYALLDAGVRFGKLDGPWELAIVGRNLTNKYYITSGQDAGTVTPGVMADAYGYIGRPRQVMFRVTVRPDKF